MENIFENAVSFEDIKQYGKNKTDKVYLHIKFVNKLLEKYQRQIDEDKLDELAVKYENKMYGYCVDVKNDIETDFSNQQNIVDIHDAYKSGYRKAMEK